MGKLTVWVFATPTGGAIKEVGSLGHEPRTFSVREMLLVTVLATYNDVIIMVMMISMCTSTVVKVCPHIQLSYWILMWAVLFVLWNCSIFPLRTETESPGRQNSNPACDKPWPSKYQRALEGKSSAVSVTNVQSAAGSVTEIADLCQCCVSGVRGGQRVSFSRLLDATWGLIYEFWMDDGLQPEQKGALTSTLLVWWYHCVHCTVVMLLLHVNYLCQTPAVWTHTRTHTYTRCVPSVILWES